jgi:hypothetical protein
MCFGGTQVKSLIGLLGLVTIIAIFAFEFAMSAFDEPGDED